MPEMFDITQLSNPTYAATMPARIDTMELMLQYARLGAASPESVTEDSWLVRGMYEIAEWGKRTGRSHFAGIGPIGALQINLHSEVNGNDTTWWVDTLCDHRPEASETRALVNLALAHGAKGLNYYKFNGDFWGFWKGDSLLHTDPAHYNYELGFGGWKVADTIYHRLNVPIRQLGSPDTVGYFMDLYVGWQATTRELRSLHTWIRRIAPLLVRLKWRDAYSIHYQTDHAEYSYDDNFTHRPLPSDEIITAVTARHPITGEVDSADETFVEIGLFDTQLGYDEFGARDPMRDSNYTFVLNRRVFETGNYAPDDVSYSTAIRDVLDSLTETREITIEFNLANPDTNHQFNVTTQVPAPGTGVVDRGVRCG